jgi:tRNA dimethylallyltransferase
VIINCDAMQIYKELSIITAQPDAADMAKTEHLMYGFRSIFEEEKYSVGKYLHDLRTTIDGLSGDCIPIIVGGSMMYVEAIIEGIDEIPEIELAQLVEMRNFFEKKSTKELFQILVEKDKKYADFLINKDASTNRQKVTRALEVVGATGKSIMDFWGNKRKLFNDFQFEKYITSLDREKLYEKINKRFDKMLVEGALEEVKTVHEKAKKSNYEEVKKALPKVIGLRELFDYFDGLITLDTAIEEAKQVSRRYAKRQLTWFRNRFISFETI